MSRAKRPCVMTELLCYDFTNIPVPEGTKRATSVDVQLLRLQTDLRMGSISRDISRNFPPNSAAAEVTCLRKWHVWCRLIRSR